MRGLTGREKVLLGFCLLTVFVVVNAFAVRWAMKTLGGSGGKIRQLKGEVADYEMWLEDSNTWAIRDKWLAQNMPSLDDGATGKAQGDLLQELQDQLFQRKLKIDRQSLREPKVTENYQEVSVQLDIRGKADTVVEWLSTLQDPEKFVVVRYLELELDNRSREVEPQAVCEIIVARWFRPVDSTLAPDPGGNTPVRPGPDQPESDTAEPPTGPPTGTQTAPPDSGDEPETGTDKGAEPDGKTSRTVASAGKEERPAENPENEIRQETDPQ